MLTSSKPSNIRQTHGDDGICHSNLDLLSTNGHPPSPCTSSAAVERFKEIAKAESFFTAWRFPLQIGCFLGLLPIQQTQESFKLFHWRTLTSTFITLLIGCNVILIGYGFPALLADSNRKSTAELIQVASGIWFYMAGMLVYAFFLIKAKTFIEFCKQWNKVSAEIKETIVEDNSLRLQVTLITFLVLGSCFGENCMFHIHVMSPQIKSAIISGDIDLIAILENYYSTNSYMYKFFNFHWPVALLFVIVNKWTLYAWNFGDVILMLLGRSFYGKFNGLNKYLEQQIKSTNTNSSCVDGIVITKGAVDWKQFRINFHRICTLLEFANGLFSPLLWLSYVTDIFFVCNQLYIELSSSSPSSDDSNGKPIETQIYILWSFLHLVGRTLTVNMIGAKVNNAANKLKILVQYCQPEEYDANVKRLQDYVNSKVIGLSGNECFIITNSFILMVTSAIFTLEVVLLQNSKIT